MSPKNKAARRKLSQLELVNELDKFSPACKVVGCSRQQLH